MAVSLEELAKKVKEKRELSGLAPSIVNGFIEQYLKKSNISLASLTQRDSKLIVKEVRARLRSHSGMFQKSSSDKEKLFKAGAIEELLNTHSSTKERFSFYPQLRELIKNLSVHSILDLGCGLNPIALASPSLEYYAADIRQDELNMVKSFFDTRGIKGRTFVYDLRNIDSNLPSADLCLLFKVVDVLEKKGHKLAEKIVVIVPCRYVLVSFSTKTLSGKPMNHPQRGWIERMISRLGYKYKIINSDHEIFYLIDKLK